LGRIGERRERGVAVALLRGLWSKLAPPTGTVTGLYDPCFDEATEWLLLGGLIEESTLGSFKTGNSSLLDGDLRKTLEPCIVQTNY